MITKVKGYLIIAMITLYSCAGTDQTEVNENTTENVLDSLVMNQHLEEMSGTENPRVDSLEIAVDTECYAHLKTVMNQSIPPDIQIIHCNYWSSEHPVWLEHSYSFQIEKNDAFFSDLVEHNVMLKIEDESTVGNEPADWFLPKTFESYYGFYTEDDFDDFQIFRDITTGTIFIRGSQY